MLKLTACNVWPDGKLNSSSGGTCATTPSQQRNGRGRRVQRLSHRYSASATAPVASMCAAANAPRVPPQAASTSISTYHTTPSPSRLTTLKKRPTARRAPQRLAARQRRWSNTGNDDGLVMVLVRGQALESGFEIGHDRVRRQRRDAQPCIAAHRAAQHRVDADRVRRADERSE